MITLTLEYNFSQCPAPIFAASVSRLDDYLPDSFPGDAQLDDFHEQPRAHVVVRHPAQRVSRGDRFAYRALRVGPGAAVRAGRQDLRPLRYLLADRAGIGRPGR